MFDDILVYPRIPRKKNLARRPKVNGGSRVFLSKSYKIELVSFRIQVEYYIGLPEEKKEG